MRKTISKLDAKVYRDIERFNLKLTKSLEAYSDLKILEYKLELYVYSLFFNSFELEDKDVVDILKFPNYISNKIIRLCKHNEFIQELKSINSVRIRLYTNNKNLDEIVLSGTFDLKDKD